MRYQITEKGERILGQAVKLVGMVIALTVFYLMAYDRGRDFVRTDCNRRIPEVDAYYAVLTKVDWSEPEITEVNQR